MRTVALVLLLLGPLASPFAHAQHPPAQLSPAQLSPGQPAPGQSAQAAGCEAPRQECVAACRAQYFVIDPKRDACLDACSATARSCAQARRQ